MMQSGLDAPGRRVVYNPDGTQAAVEEPVVHIPVPKEEIKKGLPPRKPPAKMQKGPAPGSKEN